MTTGGNMDGAPEATTQVLDDDKAEEIRNLKVRAYDLIATMEQAKAQLEAVNSRLRALLGAQ